MADAALAALPLAALALLALAGSGVAALLPGAPADARAALAPPAAFAVLAVASTLLPLGVPAGPLAAAVIVLLVASGIVAGRRVLRGAAVPLALAAGAVVVASVPALARGDWNATTLYGSTDAYHWVSQSRAYFDAPAPEPAAEHPDRLPYERAEERRWAVALAFALGPLAWLSGADESETYGALAALLHALLPLAAYAAARAALGWSRAWSAAAGGAVALNASLLFAAHFSWQQQAAGSALAFGAALALWLGLGPGSRRPLALAALLAAGALGTYRLGFSPYLAALLGGVVLVSARRGAAGRRAGLFVAAAAALALPSLVALARGMPGFVDSGGFSTAFKESFPAGQPAEALGLVPRVWALEEGWPAWLRAGWLVAATALAVWLLALGVRRERSAFVLGGSALVLGGWALLLVPAFAPYLSYKLLSYGAPFLVLLALASRARIPLAAAGALLAVSAIVATLAVDGAARPRVRLAAGDLPQGVVVRVTAADPWTQAWQLYDLRDAAVSVERPSYLLTEQGSALEAGDFRRGRVTHAVAGSRVVQVGR